MAFDKITLLWARYEQLERAVEEAEKSGDEQRLDRARMLLAYCAQLIAKAQADQEEDE
jgi:hypothetical protein